MFENIRGFFRKFGKNEKESSKNTAKERLHLVLAQDRANISADFLEMMKQEIIDVIKKYIDIDEEAIDVKMTNKPGEDGTVGAPALYANIPIVTIKNEARKLEGTTNKEEKKLQEAQKEENKNNIQTESKQVADLEENKLENNENCNQEIERVEENLEKEENQVNDKIEVSEIEKDDTTSENTEEQKDDMHNVKSNKTEKTVKEDENEEKDS